jgi:pimeloyl-ACP methyl ester carboxylesterase
MGGWLALLLCRLLQRRGEAGRLAALVLIAPAWDMTEELIWPSMGESERESLARLGQFMRPSPYGAYPITRRLLEEARAHLLTRAPLTPPCPVRILHGMRDGEVPWQHSLRLVELLGSDDIRLILVKDAEHRLSREADLALAFSVLEEFLPKSGA